QRLGCRLEIGWTRAPDAAPRDRADGHRDRRLEDAVGVRDQRYASGVRERAGAIELAHAVLDRRERDEDQHGPQPHHVRPLVVVARGAAIVEECEIRREWEPERLACGVELPLLAVHLAAQVLRPTE